MNYKSKRWNKMRQKILRRDGYRDVELARYGKAVEANTVHHVFPADEYPQYKWEPWNMVSLSQRTHNEMHDRNTGALTEKGKALMNRVARQRGIST